MNQPTKGFIAVHLGAGQHSKLNKEKYLKLGRNACEKGIESLKSSRNVVEAIADAITVLEDSPLTNAGYGSNLTYNGNVECDASVMDGSNLQYGAVGAVSGIKNPIVAAKFLCQYQTVDIGNGRVPPSLLTGSGAFAWAKKMGIECVPPEDLISLEAYKVYKHYKRKVEGDDKEDTQQVKKRMDTVGAVCVDEFGNIAAACSSGGIILKFPGRVGQAGIWGCGSWASKGNVSVGSSTSGCGEHLIRTSLARTIADSVINTDCPTTSLYNSMKSDFIDSKFLQGLNEKLGGVITIRYSAKENLGDFLWSHSTNSMVVAYMNSSDKKAESRMSILPVSDIGKKSIVEGIMFRLKKIEETE